MPRHLRDAHYGGAARLGNGKDYQYAHEITRAVLWSRITWVSINLITPRPIAGYEATIRQYLAGLRGRPATRSTGPDDVTSDTGQGAQSAS